MNITALAPASGTGGHTVFRVGHTVFPASKYCDHGRLVVTKEALWVFQCTDLKTVTLTENSQLNSQLKVQYYSLVPAGSGRDPAGSGRVKAVILDI